MLEPVSQTRRIATDVADIFLGQHVAPDSNAVSMLPAQALLTLHMHTHGIIRGKEGGRREERRKREEGEGGGRGRKAHLYHESFVHI